MTASVLNCSRKNIYYQKVKDLKDQTVKNEIEFVHKDNPAYGYRRVAMALKLGKKSPEDYAQIRNKAAKT